MSEGIGVTEPPELGSESLQLNSKRKPESPRSDDDPRTVAKTPRLDSDQNPNPDNHDASVGNGEKAGVVEKEEGKVLEQGGGQCKDGLGHKGKGKMVVQEEEKQKPNARAYVDKGKGKMIVEEEEEESSDDDSDEEEAGVVSGSESEYSDDPLMEVDLNNILPSRTRRWAPPVPGAYLVPEDQDEDDDDDSDVGGGDDDEEEEGDSESE